MMPLEGYLERWGEDDTCAGYFNANVRDRWVITHTVLPMALVRVAGLRPLHVMLLVYVFETLEIATASCGIGLRIEKVVDIVVLDPVAGALGIAAALAMGPASASPSVARFLASLAPTVALWLINDDTAAQLAFGGLCLLLYSFYQWERPMLLYVAALTAALALIPWNTHVLNLCLHAGLVFTLFRTRPPPPPPRDRLTLNSFL